MVKEGFPFVIVPAIVALAFAALQFWAIAVIFAALTGFMAYFFRDPERVIPSDQGLIVSAADGRVTRIQSDESGKLVSVFLSPLDVHINRSPIEGAITNIEYVVGSKLPATNNRASFENERNSLTIENDHISVVCTQIAGVLARRIVCWKKVGDQLHRGERFGLIKFSSRTDLLMPDSVELSVKVGDRVRGGETVVAKYDRSLPVTELGEPAVEQVFANG
jgi:phosphatidylserine decarboxylase